MSMNEIWQKFDDEMQDKFQGDYGAAAYGELFTIAIMFGTYELLLHKIPPKYHPHFKAHWYASWANWHPLHHLRMAAQDAIAQTARKTYDPEHNRIQAQFENLGNTVRAKVLELARNRDHSHTAPLRVKAEAVNDKLDEMASYIDELFEPQPRRARY